MSAARAEAQRLMRYAAEHGTVDPPQEIPTFERFVRDTFVPLVMTSYTPATRERYGRLFEREGLFQVLGRKRLDEIDTRAVLELAATVRERGAVPRQHQIVVRVVLKTAVRLAVLSRMPDLPPTPRQAKKLPAAPPREAVEAMLDGSDGWLLCAIALAYFAGMRSGEARAFRVMDAGVELPTASIRQAYSHDEVQPPKYGADRAVPMHPRLLEIVRAASIGKKPRDLLIVDENGTSPSRQKLYKATIALQRRLGIEPTWSYHRLRHAFGTHALAGGANIEAVRDLMGHSDLATTTRYVHAIARDKLAVIEALGGNTGQQRAGQPAGNGGSGAPATE